MPCCGSVLRARRRCGRVKEQGRPGTSSAWPRNPLDAMCHSLLDGNGPRTNLFFHKERLWHEARLQVWAPRWLFDVDSFFTVSPRIPDFDLWDFDFFRLLFNKRPEAAPLTTYLGIPRSTVCRLSPLQAITLISSPSTQLLQLRDYYPSISPASHPGITSSKHQRLIIRPGQHHATGDPRRERYILANTTVASHRPTGVPLCLPGYPGEETLALRFFFLRNVKANGSGESRAASVCLSCLQPAPLHLCTCTCTIQPTPDSAGIRQSASSGRHKGASQPVSRPQRIDSSSRHRQIR